MKFRARPPARSARFKFYKAPWMPAPIPGPCGRAAARPWRPRPSPTRRRAAGRPRPSRPRSPLPPARPTRRPTTPMPAATRRPTTALPARSRAPADRAVLRQRRLRLRRPPAPSRPDLPEHQLLGRRRLQSQQQRRQPGADGEQRHRPAVTRNTPVTFSTSTLLANDTDPNGDPLTVTASPAEPAAPRRSTPPTRPSPSRRPPASRGRRIHLRDLRPGTAAPPRPTSPSPSSATGSGPVSLFPTGTPATTNTNDTSPVELA